MIKQAAFLLLFLYTALGILAAAGKQEADQTSLVSQNTTTSFSLNTESFSVNTRIRGIFKLWIETEDSLTLEKISAFDKTLQTYLNSERHRIFRLAPISRNVNFGASEPNEMPEIEEAALLTRALYDSIVNSDYEKTSELSENIYRNLAQAMAKDIEVEQFAVGAYFRLFLILIIFIMLSVALVISLNKDLKLSLQREEETIGYSRAVLLAQEDERARLSRELHDTVIQDLRYLSLESVRIGRIPEPQERVKLCAQTASMQTELITRVRNICEYLIPPDFCFQSLDTALRNLCDFFSKRTGIEFRMIIDTNELKTAKPGKEEQLQIFRIVQEALSNIEKHASATEAIVALREDEAGCLFISITDDGKGFDCGSKTRKKQLGIRGMNERAALLGGSIKIVSESGQGTTVRLSLPAKTHEKAGSL